MKDFIFTKEVEQIFKIFLKDGEEIMLVGGCIRDFLLNKSINDHDFTIKYKPEEVEKILKNNNIKYFTTGIKFGTITAVINGKKFEITSARRDIKTDGRRAVVEFTDDYFEDAKRRDFTFNALYMNFSKKIYDFFGGINDLKEGKIRFIGNAKGRIIEDNLRIFRFFRFYGSCADYLDYEGLKACIECKNLIKNLSKERITEEFLKILNIDYCVKSLKIMEKIGILQEITNININMGNLEIFYSLKDFIKYKQQNNLFILALILSKNDVKFDFILSNKEKRYLSDVIESDFKTDFSDNLYESFGFEVKKLLFLLRDKNLVRDVIVLNFCNKYKNIESFNNLKLCLNILDNIDIPAFDVKIEDLILFGFNDKKEFSKIIKLAKKLYVENNFKLNEKEILKLIKDNKSEYF